MEKAVSAFSKVAFEEDEKLWIRQARAKYYKAEYEMLQKEDAQLDNKIDEEKTKQKKMEHKISKIKKIKEDLMSTITISSNVVKHLIERRNDVRRDAINWKDKICEREKEMETFLNQERKKREEGNELYKQVQEKRNALKLIKIKYNILLKKSEVQKRQIKTRLEVNQKLFHSKIITFVRGVMNYNRMVEICKEIDTTKAAIQEISLKLNQPAQRKLLTFQANVPKEFFHQPIASPWSLEKFSYTKMITTDNVQENTDLIQLQKRSDQRKKQFLQMLDGPLSVTRSPQVGKIKAVEDKPTQKENADLKASQQQRPKERKRQYIEVLDGPTNTSQVKTIEDAEDTQGNKPIVSPTPNKSHKKIKLLENIVIPENIKKLDFPALKQPEPAMVKRVSFGPLVKEKERMVWNNSEEEQNRTILSPAGDDNISGIFQNTDCGIFNESEAMKDNIGYSFLSPNYDVAETTLENLNESANQMRDDFFVTPQASGNEAPSIFSNFGFGDNHQASSGNHFFF